MKLLTIIFICLFSFTVQAKITLDNKEMTTQHVNTVKGFIYEAFVSSENTGNKQEQASSFAASIAWLEKALKEKKVYELSTIKTNKITGPVFEAINQIVDFVNNEKISKRIKNFYLTRWTKTGKRVELIYRSMKKKKVYLNMILKKEINKNENNKR